MQVYLRCSQGKALAQAGSSRTMEQMSSAELPKTTPSPAGRTLRPTLLAVLVVAAIGVLSFLPIEDKRVLHTKGRFHEWGHLFAFMAVAFVLLAAAKTWPARLLLFAGALLFGLGIEYGQHRVYGMPAETMDMIVDATGVILGSILALGSSRFGSSRLQNQTQDAKTRHG